jgi:hypothetical protein
MKTPETVTLIDLQGKELYEIDPKDARHSNAYVKTYSKYENSQPHVVYSYDKTYVPLHPRKTQVDRTYNLSDFLNDQLTFIRNGMWETLAIYQATLGRYWEVPWYHCPQDTMYTWLNPFKGGQVMEWGDKTPKPFTTKYINDIFTEDMKKHIGFISIKRSI